MKSHYPNLDAVAAVNKATNFGGRESPEEGSLIFSGGFVIGALGQTKYRLPRQYGR
jgi:hypothetical protein